MYVMSKQAAAAAERERGKISLSAPEKRDRLSSTHLNVEII